MSALKKLGLIVALIGLAGGLLTPAFAHNAKVVKLTGKVEIQLPGLTTPQLLTPDMPVPEGAVIKTSAGAQLLLETFSGAVAAIQADATVIVEKLVVTERGGAVVAQEAMLDLKKGSIVSTLDPAKRAINRYGVRTPKGVAAAHGTVYGVSVTISGTSVATLNGFVSMDLGNGVTVSIPVGTGTVNNSDTVAALSDAIAASGQDGLTVAQLLQETVQAVAANVAASSSAVSNSDTAVAVMAAVVNAAATAQPEQAASFTQTAVAAVSSSTSSTVGNNTAVAAITEAAVRAAPAATAAIAQSAAQAVVETRVTEAVQAAQATGGDAQAAAAVASQAAAATVATIAQTAVSAAAEVGTIVDPTTVVTAVTTGSSTGAIDAGSVTGTTPPPPPAPPAAEVTEAAADAPSIEVPAPPAPVIITPDLPPVSGSGLPTG